MALDNRLLKISQDAQDVVRLSTIGANKIVEMELDTITYTVKNNAGTVVGQFKGRNNQETAHNFASDRDKEAPWEYPHTVEAQSNIKLKQDGSINIGESKFGTIFPTEKIKSITLQIQNNTDCDFIKQVIDDEMSKLGENLKAAVSETANLAQLNPLLSLPSDPLKILSWARKVVNTFFGPYTLALIDLALNLAEFAGALASLASAISAAQQNLTLCAYSVAEDTVNSALDGIDRELNKVTKDIDDAMDKIDDAQNKISQVTGSTKRFLPNRQGLTLGEGITQNARTKLTQQINEQVNNAFPAGSVDSFKTDLTTYGALPFDQDPQAQADASAFANSVGTSLQSNSTFSSTLLSASGAFSGDVSIPNADTSVSGQGVSGKFEIITARGTSDQVRYQVENGIITGVTVGLP